VNFRQGPSTSATVIQVLRAGEVVNNLGQRQSAGGITWQQVRLGTTEGWVDAEYLAPQRD
jgi:uncharacterized protein YraI